jgi:ABC-2 type transport system permease protein
MNMPSSAMPESSLVSEVHASAPGAVTRPMYWSMRRELWENRWLYLAPLGVAALFLLGFLISMTTLPHRMRALSSLDPAQQRAAIEKPYEVAAGLIMGAAFLVGLFYCLEALHGERRDRSILFWKSLPVSDRTSVLAKAAIVFFLQPFTWAVTVATYLIMLLLSTIALSAAGMSVTPLWTLVAFVPRSMMLGYHLLSVHALWYAPIYAWLLLVSAWARRAPFLWALLPPLAIAIAEKIAFNTSHFSGMIQYRLTGPQQFSFNVPDMLAMDPMMYLDPARFLSTPGLWTGLALAAVFLAAAVRVRRLRGPI